MKNKILTNILSEITSGIILTTIEGKIIFINNMAREILQIKGDQFIDKHITQIKMESFNMPLKEVIIRQFREKRKNSEPIQISKIPFTRKDSSIGFLFLELKIISFDENEYMMLTFRDISKTINLELYRRDVFDKMMKNLSSRLFKESAERIKLESQVEDLHHKIKGKIKFGDIIGKNVKMQKIFELIKSVSETNANILITGETGTGKELVARAVHNNSSRKNSPFIKVDCASLTDTLLESELFGHEKGSFTGAYKQRRGRFELADKGTIFLDEISNTSLRTQAKLLRVLQDSEFERVGGEETLKVDVRVIAATNVDLYELVKKSNFREDLFYRLNVIAIDIPPLRDRKDDVPLIALHFLNKYSKIHNKNIKSFSGSAMIKLLNYGWQGNIREMENVIEQAIVLCKKREISDNDIILQEDYDNKQGNGSVNNIVSELYMETGEKDLKYKYDVSLKKYLDLTEKEVIKQALIKFNGNISKISKVLKVNRTTLYSKIKKYKIGFK